MHVLLLFAAIMFLILSIMMINNNWIISMEMSILTLNDINMMASLLMDWISAMFISTVMIISSMILMYSTSYIPKSEYKQFSLIMICFVTSMLTLIVSENIIFMLLGWDGLGLSSYMLVIYYQNFSSASSGMITILSNRLGDMAILLTIGSLMYKMNWNFLMNENYYKITLILLVVAAISKSAQFPFSSWLPAAMAAPTPISALVHSSTLVTAGVFILIRVMNNIHPMVMMTLIMLSTATTIYASMSANWEQDMKKIIALSTLSQIGMMMFVISIGSVNIAFFHLITHALFKSMMFMTAGVMIHNYSYQDMRHMSMMNYMSPIPPMIMMISSMALMGLPFMSGFYSKDTIIELLMDSSLASVLTFTMTASLGMTSMYSMRMFKFSMNSILKMKKDNMFFNNLSMEIPLLIMAPYSIFSGTLIVWTMMPTPMFFMPLMMKLSIILMVTMGFSLSLILNFNSTYFKKMGKIPLSLWLMNHLSTIPSKMFYNMMKILQKNDKSWQEMYGPMSVYYSIKKAATIPHLLVNKPLFIMMIILSSPIFILLL